MNTFREIANYFSTNQQLPWLQIATWNDYDEGTQIETGIDNCVSNFTANFTPNTAILNWSLTIPDDRTIDHFEIFDSSGDGNLYRIYSTANGQARTADLTGLIGNGQRYIYVEAIGVSSVLNHLLADPGVPYPSTGLGPAVRWSSNSLNFGSQRLTTTSSATPASLTNTGNAPLTIYSIAASGDFSVVSTTCPVNLSAQASCSISLVFRPTAAGERQGILTVNDNERYSPHTVSLVGTGTP